jgi:hypothetical protein
VAWLVDGRGSRDSVEPVVPLCEQFKAQHKRAAETSGVRLSTWTAFLQQSMPAIPGMLHSCSFEWRGIPAKTLPPITSTNASDAKRVTMPHPIYGSHPTFVKECSNQLKRQKRSRVPCECRYLSLHKFGCSKTVKELCSSLIGQRPTNPRSGVP